MIFPVRLYDPQDGDIDPAQLTQALAKGARDMGARIVRLSPATGVSREGVSGSSTPTRAISAAEYVVNAAGYYAQRVAEWFKPYGGRTVPMMVMSHQYLLSEEIPEIAAWSKESGSKLPLLRDVDSSYYLRQEKNGFNLGPYERNCRAHWVDPHRPDAGGFQLSAVPRRSGAAGMVYRGCDGPRAPAGHGACPRSSTARSPMRPTASR